MATEKDRLTAPSVDEQRLSEGDFELLYSAVEQIAELLSDVALFKANVREKLSSKEKPLPQVWNDVLEILPDKPLLSKVDGQWHWLFDIDASPLTITPSETLVPESVTPVDVNVTLQRISTVEAADQAVRDFTDERIGLAILATELRLLEISPPFSSFTGAAASYRANAGKGPQEFPYPSLYDDRALIEEYWTMFLRSVKSIQRVMFLAQYLAYQIAQPPAPVDRAHTLRLLCRDLDFAQLSSEQVGQLLRGFEVDFGNLKLGISDVSLAFSRIDSQEQALDGYWPARTVLDIQSDPPQPPPEDLVRIYFSDRTGALILHARNSQPLRRLNLAELQARAAGLVPAFHGNPNDIPLSEYADALAAAFKNKSAPAATTFALAVLGKLGFGKRIESTILTLAQSGDALTGELYEVTATARSADEALLLILGGAKEELAAIGGRLVQRTAKFAGSSAALWKPSQRIAVLPIHHSDVGLLTLFIAPGVWLLDALNISLQLFDETLDPSTIPIGNLAALQFQLGGSSKVAVSIGAAVGIDEAVVLMKKYLTTPA